MKPKRAFAREELMRNLDQHAGAIARFRIAATGSAMRQVDQDLHALRMIRASASPLNIDDEADAAGIMFICWIVQTLAFGS